MKPDFSTLNRDNIVAFIGDIFERRGGEEYLGEPVTMAEHMLQGATIAEQNGMPEEIIVGALLHDIGHFTSEFGTYHPDDTEDRHHEDAGAEVLEQFFPSVITDCCRYHVAAKRYLCAREEGYFRLEWHLAEQRTYLMAQDKAFLFPVVIDDTSDATPAAPTPTIRPNTHQSGATTT